ncbi:uncharacterized protein [Miscanthus floridulus]|uniref:uncharacterized protein n=1 Tax=Miscanthus floridulus TaxID=154761 RepID=UPI003459AE3B
MSAGAPPSSLDPRSSRVVAPLAPVAMPSPPPAPPAAASDEKRPSPPLKMKLLFPYAVNCVFGGMGRTWGMALVGLHFLISVVRVVSFTTDPEEARFWIPIFRVWVYLGLAAIVLMTCVDIGYYLYGLYALKFDPPQQQPAAVQLPPPPPEIDMC